MLFIIGIVGAFILARAWFKSPKQFMKDAGDDPADRALAFFWGVIMVGFVGMLIAVIIMLINPWAPMIFFWIPSGVAIFGLICCIIAAIIVEGKRNS